MRRDLSVINLDPVQWIRVRISDLIDLLYPTYPSLHVVRPDDLLALTFCFVNLKLQKAQRGEEHAWLLPGKNALILVDFQAQNIAAARLAIDGGQVHSAHCRFSDAQPHPRRREPDFLIPAGLSPGNGRLDAQPPHSLCSLPDQGRSWTTLWW